MKFQKGFCENRFFPFHFLFSVLVLSFFCSAVFHFHLTIVAQLKSNRSCIYTACSFPFQQRAQYSTSFHNFPFISFSIYAVTPNPRSTISIILCFVHAVIPCLSAHRIQRLIPFPSIAMSLSLIPHLHQLFSRSEAFSNLFFLFPNLSILFHRVFSPHHVFYTADPSIHSHFCLSQT